MSEYRIQGSTLDAIADAINAKTGSSSAMTPAEMVTAIGNIPSGGGGLEFEEGVYTAAADGNPTISFAGNYSEPPAVVEFWDTSTTFADPNAGAWCTYAYFPSLANQTIPTDGSGGTTNAGYGAIARGSSAITGGGGVRNAAVTAAGFTPFFGATARTCKSGRTYKWIAIWR